jgi:hypothetical protein
MPQSTRWAWWPSDAPAMARTTPQHERSVIQLSRWLAEQSAEEA